jgi:trehalose 6-phosphate synthase
VTYLQIATKSRSEIPEYADIERDIGSAAGRINDAFGEADWTPIRYINHPYSHSTLAGLYRAARVGLVTPVYVASQNPDDPGVLILSAPLDTSAGPARGWPTRRNRGPNASSAVLIARPVA